MTSLSDNPNTVLSRPQQILLPEDKSQSPGSPCASSFGFYPDCCDCFCCVDTAFCYISTKTVAASVLAENELGQAWIVTPAIQKVGRVLASWPFQLSASHTQWFRCHWGAGWGSYTESGSPSSAVSFSEFSSYSALWLLRPERWGISAGVWAHHSTKLHPQGKSMLPDTFPWISIPIQNLPPSLHSPEPSELLCI